MQKGSTIKPEESRWRKLLTNAAMNITGSILLAFGVCAFIQPFDMIVGGVTGISLVFHRLFGIRVSLIALVINVLVFIPGWFFGGKKLVAGSAVSSLIYPAAMAGFECFPVLTTIADSVLLATICGSVVCGTGIALVIRSGGSTGGLDIPILILCKKIKKPFNTVLRVADTVIMLCQIPLFGITGILYGLIYTWLMTNVMGKVLTYGEERLKITVVSEHAVEICSALVANDFGVTMVYGESGYTKTQIKQIESVTTAHLVRAARKVIDEIDPAAFITIENVREVHGQGFTREREPLELE